MSKVGKAADTLPAGDNGKYFELVPYNKVFSEKKPRYLIKGILPKTGIGIMYGDKKSYKSFIALDMMMHVALGVEYRDHKTCQGSVVYLVLEGQGDFPKRIDATRAHFKAANKEVPIFLIYNRTILEDDHKALIRSIKAQTGEGPPVAVVIDTLKRVINGSENDDAAMGALLDAAQAISDEIGCFTMLVHHTGHGGAHPRGHSSLGAAVDVQIRVEKKGIGQVSATIELAKDLPEGECWHSFVREVSLMDDDEGDRITSMVIDPMDAPTDREPEPKIGKPHHRAKNEHGLTKRQMQIICAMHASPQISLKQLALNVELKAPSGMHEHLAKLATKKLVRQPKVGGDWRLTAQGAALARAEAAR